MQFVITLKGDLGVGSYTLYKQLEYAHINVLVTDCECYIYDFCNNYVLSDILNKCWAMSHNLQLNITKDPVR